MKKRTLTIFAACLMLFPLLSFSQPSVCGGNGSPDGAQVNRDYAFCVDDLPSFCELLSFRVVNQNSTSLHQLVGNTLFLVWKPSYVGTTQTIEVKFRCQISFLDFTETATFDYTLHN
ncbi:hypothetical protein [Ekhidna sp.]